MIVSQLGPLDLLMANRFSSFNPYTRLENTSNVSPNLSQKKWIPNMDLCNHSWQGLH
jgi:hypothetical protein